MLHEILNKDYEFIGLATVNPDRDDDFLRTLQISDRLAAVIPQHAKGHRIYDLMEKVIDKIVYEPDKRLVFNATRRGVILEQLKKSEIYRFGFRIYLNGAIRTIRISFLTAEKSEENKQQYFVTIQVVDGGQENDIETYFAADTLLDDYGAIYLVDTDRDLIESIRIIKEYGMSFHRQTESKSYSERMAYAVENNIAPEDRSYVMKKLSPDNVLKTLESRSVDSFSCRAVDKNGEIYYYEVKYSRRYGPGRNGFIVGIKNIDSEIKERKFDEAITLGMAADYDCVIYMNLERENDERILSARDSFLRNMPGWERLETYEDRKKMFIDTMVMPRDRQRVQEATSVENILSELRKHPAYFVNFRIIINDEVRYYQLKFTGDIKNGIARGVVAGFLDVNDTMREDFQKEAELSEAKEKAEKEIIRKTAELRERNRALTKINDEIVEMLADVVEMRDSGGNEHVIKVKAFSNILAECVKNNLEEYRLTDEDVELITSASVLHDIGKILISDTILLKPGKLTEEEFGIMQNHCNKGCDILMRASRSWGEKYLKLALDICRYHHEKWDGKGYPEGLKGDDIPIAAQIVSVADCYDALTSRRVYDDLHEAEDALDMILRGECGEYSDKLMDCLRECREKFIEALNNPKAVIDKYLEENEKNDINVLEGLDILIADDDPISREIGRDILESEGARVTEACDGAEAVEKLKAMPFVDAIIMDVHMPKMDGIEATRVIREIEENLADHVPIIAYSVDTSMVVMDKMMEAGADESIKKPLDIEELTRILLSSMRMRSAKMERKLAESVKDANTDPLTKLRNRKAYENMTATIEDEIRSPFPPEFAIVVCDINNLKTVNDTRGHDMGDVYIKNCCRILCETFTHSPVFRIGGDEFTIILRGRDYTDREKLMDALDKKVAVAELYEDVLKGKASLAAGISSFNINEDTSVEEVEKRADDEMYRNKKLMKERIF